MKKYTGKKTHELPALDLLKKELKIKNRTRKLSDKQNILFQ
jgi:hypothetical protein